MTGDNLHVSHAMPLMALPRTARQARWRMPASWRAGSAIALWRAGILLAAYVFADSATSLFPNARFGVQPISPHPAIAIALIAVGGSAYLPAVCIAILAAWSLAHAGGWAPSFIPAAIATSAVYGAAAWALRRWARWNEPGIGPRDVNVLLAVCVPTALACAFIDALRQVLEPGLTADALPLLTMRVFIAQVLGLVVLAPLLLQATAGCWVPQLRNAGWHRAARDGAVFLLVLAALLDVVFGLRPLDEFRMSYLLFLPMIVIAMRNGVFGVSTLLPFVQLGLLVALMMVGMRPGFVFEFQLLLLTLAVAALYLGALSDERRRSAESIAGHERTLRERGLALAEAQRLASTAELAAALAHDLSQPLSAIGTYASASHVLAGRGPAEHERLLATLDQITRESARAGQYLHRMRDFFRTGTMQLECMTVAELLARTQAHLEDRMARAAITWCTTLAPDLPAVRVDAVQIGAVLGNLAANACDALADCEGVRLIHLRALVVAGSDPLMVRLTIEDSGRGIAPELRERLFRPMATSKPHGMGLGLALSRSIAERQGGHLWYDSDRESTTFCLDLPAHA